jgi:outer membrane protein insertion porin family
MVRVKPHLAALVVAAAAIIWPSSASAQGIEPCSAVEPPNGALPPEGSAPLVRCLETRFHPVNEPILDVETTYLYYIKTRWSIRGDYPETPEREQVNWVPFDEAAVLRDFDALWKTNFLEDLWIEVLDEPYENGVMGKHVIFHMEERARLKAVEYDGSTKVPVSDIEDALRDQNILPRFDTFIDQATIRRIQTVIRTLYSDRGHAAATVTPVMTPIGGGPKLVRLTFQIDEGPVIKIREVDFQGNEAFDDGDLIGAMKENKPGKWWSFIMSTGTYHENKFEEDAEKVVEFYQNRGYLQARVGQPQIETIEDSADGKKRYIKLTIPVDEGVQYRVGTFDVAGNTAVKSDILRKAFKVKEGEIVKRETIVKGMEELHKLYGIFGYWQADATPEFCFRGTNCATGEPLQPNGELPPIVDVTMRINEGKQYRVNRITFLGNTTTHDRVIRREMRVFEGGVFNSEALTESIKRLNQLGYFKPMEDAEAVQVTPAGGSDSLVDIKLRFEEQNRNTLQFGAGVSQFDGFFGQLAFSTSNFLGRGETLSVQLQKGGRARNYQLSISEPYLFNRPIGAGLDVYARQFIFLNQFTEDEVGGGILGSVPIGGYKRLSIGYSYAQIRIFDINEIYAGLLQDIDYRISKITPGFFYNTVDHPIFPTQGTRYSASVGIAGIGGDTRFYTTSLEGIWYLKLNNRTSLGFRAQMQYAKPYDDTILPISERVFLGGEYSVRGFDLRSIGPRDPQSGAVIGGNKSLVFNAEYLINVVGPVRFLLFYDAGQVRGIGQDFVWRDPIRQLANPPLLFDPLRFSSLNDPNAPPPVFTTVGHQSAFKTSTGAELRFFMPVLNVPFRLIAAWNPQRTGVLNNNLRPTPRFVFRFAVGTTF